MIFKSAGGWLGLPIYKGWWPLDYSTFQTRSIMNFESFRLQIKMKGWEIFHYFCSISPSFWTRTEWYTVSSKIFGKFFPSLTKYLRNRCYSALETMFEKCRSTAVALLELAQKCFEFYCISRTSFHISWKTHVPILFSGTVTLCEFPKSKGRCLPTTTD